LAAAAGSQVAPAGVNLWAVGAVVAAICLPIALTAGFTMGHGHVNQLFGVDWTQVDWHDVGKLLLIVLAMNVVLLPLAYLLSPRPWKKLVTWMVAIALWTPLGLITPGIAFAEFVPANGATEVPGVGYLPSGLNSLSRTYHAILPGYQVPWISGSAPVSQQAFGYMLSGFIGMCVLMLLGILLYTFVKRRLPQQRQDDDWRTAT
jgi:hypothetical protein